MTMESQFFSQSIRNIAIIAHVDHGKTTLVDALFQQSGMFSPHQHIEERVMDSLDLERERGITIAAKNASIIYNNTRINIVDTPGHADFGGEVERSLMMVDGAILLVDAAEGCLPQTRFVLQKALMRNLAMIVVINKVDRPDARIDEVEEEIHDLFCELATHESHLNFPTLYASGRQGWCSLRKDEKTNSLEPLFQTILTHVPPPQVHSPDAPVKMLIANLAYNPYVGRLAIGRIEQGTLKPQQNIVIIGKNNQPIPAKVVSLKAYRGLEQVDVESLPAGDIAIVATGVDELAIGDTISDPTDLTPLPRIEVDPPTVAVEVSVNTSPLAGREGSYLTSRKLYEFLQREAMYNVALQIEPTDSPEVFLLKARGELQVSVVIEKLRREGGECMVGRPKILTREEDGVTYEPIEHVVIDVPETFVGVVTEKLSSRKGKLLNMHPFGTGRVRLEFEVPSRGMLGFRNIFLTDTKGEGLMSSYVKGYEPLRSAYFGRINGALVADRSGKTTQYALFNLEDRGRLFVAEGEEVYEGMVIGEHNRDNDLDVNAIREKKLTNMRAAGSDESTKLSPITRMTFETALEWINDDEWIEVTPKNIRIRKKVLEANKRATLRRDKINKE